MFNALTLRQNECNELLKLFHYPVKVSKPRIRILPIRGRKRGNESMKRLKLSV